MISAADNDAFEDTIWMASDPTPRVMFISPVVYINGIRTSGKFLRYLPFGCPSLARAAPDTKMGSPD
jgi:hypothetical protein